MRPIALFLHWCLITLAALLGFLWTWVKKVSVLNYFFDLHELKVVPEYCPKSKILDLFRGLVYLQALLAYYFQ